MTSLDQLLGKLDIGSQREEREYVEQLKATEFSIFQPLADLGYFAWHATGNYKSLSSIKSEDEILRYINLGGKPDRLMPTSQIKTPRAFQYPENTAYKSKFPYSEIDIACVHVAVKRGLDLDQVDFCFGGSTLEILANKDDSDPFIASFIPGTKCILVVKKKGYEKNLADVGFQFERYVTGSSMMDTKNTTDVEHIHTMQIGTKKVLFRAEVDAMHADGSLVEVKASNPRYWGTKVMFQMISSGSSKLCHGQKSRGVLTRVTLKTLSKVSRESLENANASSLQKNIVQGMDAIQSQLKDDGKHMITFSCGSLKLIPVSDSSYELFPPDRTVKRLLTM